MKEEQKELLRHAVLLQLEAAAPASLPLSALRQGVRLAGHGVAPEELAKEVSYLCGKGLALEAEKRISKGVRRYRLSAEGRDYLEEHGLA